MPNMADIVVKDASAANVTLTSLSASAGDKVPARWRLALSDPAIPFGLRPVFEAVSSDNGPKTARRVVMSGQWPVTYTDTSTAQKGLVAKVPFRAEFTLPTNVSAAEVAQAITVQTNFMASTLMQSVLSTGYAPT